MFFSLKDVFVSVRVEWSLNNELNGNGGKAAIPQSLVSFFQRKRILKTLYAVHVLGCSLKIIITIIIKKETK